MALKDVIALYVGDKAAAKAAKVEGPMNIQEMLEEYALWDELSAELENAKKEADKKRETVETAVMLHFENEGMSSAKVAGLGTFSMTSMTRASIKTELKEKAIAAMKLHYPDMVQETVNAQTLSGFVNNSLKNQIEIAPDVMECLSVFKKSYISWRK